MCILAGLFQRAILQSGTALCPWAMGARHADVAEYAGFSLNCTTDEGSEKLLSCLQEADPVKLTSVGYFTSVSNSKMVYFMISYGRSLSTGMAHGACLKVLLGRV